MSLQRRTCVGSDNDPGRACAMASRVSECRGPAPARRADADRHAHPGPADIHDEHGGPFYTRDPARLREASSPYASTASFSLSSTVRHRTISCPISAARAEEDHATAPSSRQLGNALRCCWWSGRRMLLDKGRFGIDRDMSTRWAAPVEAVGSCGVLRAEPETVAALLRARRKRAA